MYIPAHVIGDLAPQTAPEVQCIRRARRRSRPRVGNALRSVLVLASMSLPAEASLARLALRASKILHFAATRARETT